MGDREVATGGDRIAQRCHAPERIGIVADELQHTEQQHRDRLVEVDQLAHLRVGQDDIGVADIGLDDGGAGPRSVVGPAIMWRR
jgi:hypothetical protein